jgi:hypothetical protein
LIDWLALIRPETGFFGDILRQRRFCFSFLAESVHILLGFRFSVRNCSTISVFTLTHFTPAEYSYKEYLWRS